MDTKTKNRPQEMGRLDKFFSSISPEHLDPIVKNPREIEHLFAAQENETNYLQSILDDESACRDFVKHFNSTILKKVQEDRNVDEFRDKIRVFWRIETAKLISLNEILPNLSKYAEEEKKRLNLDNLNVQESILSKLLGDARSKIARESIRDELIRVHVLNIKPIGFVSSQVSEMFFVFEFNCKVICGMGCYDVARKLSLGEVIQHREIWKTLKRLSQKDNKCKMCFAFKTCRFKIDFRRIANVYACMMKIRQLTDYSEIFYLHKHFVEDLIKYPFKSAKVVHKLADKIIRKSNFLYSPTTDEDFGIAL